MGDITTINQSITVPSTFQCPILNSSNYQVWSMKMRVLLRIHKVWDTIDPGSTDPHKNDIATGLLFQSISESLVIQVGEQGSPKAIWDAIKARNLGADRVMEARLQTLQAEFEKIKMRDSDTIDSFSGKLSELASRSASLGEAISETKLVKKFLSCLPRGRYIHIVASIEQMLDLKTISFEEIIGRLKTYEERILEEETHHEPQGKLLFANSDQQRFAKGRGRGRGRERGRGRGRGSYHENTKAEPSNSKQKKDYSKIVCFRCDKSGHFASVCPEKRERIQEANKVETEEADLPLYMHEIVIETVFLNEDKVIPKMFKTKKEEEGVWYLDNGASNHMTSMKEYFCELNESIKGKVRFGDGSCVEIGGKGSILFQSKTKEQQLITDIYYIPSLQSNILSLGQITEIGCDVRMRQNYLTVHDPNGRLLVKVIRSPNRLYKVNLQVGKPICLLTEIEDVAWRWHARMGHVSFNKLKLMVREDMVRGIPEIRQQGSLCESCLVGKQIRQSFPKHSVFRASKPLELLHGDLCGPITPSTIANNKYVFVIVDDCSRYMWSILLKEKSDAFEKFKVFKGMIEKEFRCMIMAFRTDRGGEFTSKEFGDFCDANGIKRQLTAPYTPQQNGVVERRNRTLMEMTRCILKAMRVPNYLWDEAVRHATYLINRVPTRALKNATPYEGLRNKKPSLEHLRVFGCVAYAKVEATNLKKLDDRSQPLVHLGIEPGSKAYRLFNPTSRRIVVSRDVVFNEKQGWDWRESREEQRRDPGMFFMRWGEVVDIGEGPVIVNNNDQGEDHYEATEGDNMQEDEIAENAEETAGNDPSTHPVSAINNTSSASNQQLQPVRRSTRHTSRPQYLNDFVLLAEAEIELLLIAINGEPRNFAETKGSSEWKKACKEEIDSINKNKTWNLIDKPIGAKIIGLKWVFKIKRNADGTINKYKARLVAKGYAQEYGVDFDEVFAPVARIETIRLLTAKAASHGWEIHHLDVKTAFLHGELREDVFVSQPEGFEKKGEESKVYKLSKALYGLKQAPRAWNTKLDQILKGMKFEKCCKENSVYRKEEEGNLLLIAVYVDDLFVTGNSMKVINEFKAGMSSKFEMSDLGKLSYYLGIEIHQGEDGIELKQEAYARKILRDAGLETCNSTQVPMEFGLKVSKALNEPEVDATIYRRNVGCLRYLQHTRPDLTFAVGVASRYMQSPRESHGSMMKQILRYLQGTMSFGLKFKRQGVQKVIGFSDSSHNIDEDDGRSTTGHIFYLGDSPITWCSQKQSTVALSSCEAEFMAATEASKQAIWLQDLLGEITGRKAERVVLYIDNKSALELTKNPVFHGRSKHIHKRYHFIRECVENELVEVEFVPGNKQRADILTKALAKVKFQDMRNFIGVYNLSKVNAKVKRENVGFVTSV